MEKDKQHSKRITVLVVEDNSANMNYLLFLLNKLKIDIVKASSGEEALDIISGVSIDCALLDINLGEGMSGITLMEELRKDDKFTYIPMIAVTAYYGEGTHAELIEKGFTDYLGKPFSLKQLRQKLSKYLAIEDAVLQGGAVP